MVEAHKDNFRLGGSEITLTSDEGAHPFSLDEADGEDEFKSFTASWIFHLDNTVRIEDLMKFFIYIVEKKKMEILHQSRYEAFVITRHKVGMKEILMKCVPCINSTKTTSFRLRCNLKNEKEVQSFEFEGLHGVPKIVNDAFKDFVKLLEKNKIHGQSEVKRVFAPTFYSKGKGDFSKLPHTEDYPMLTTNRSFMIVEEHQSSESNLEVNKIVEINRMLADDQYSLGKKVASFTESFKESLNNTENPDLKEHMMRLYSFCKEIHQIIRKEGNLGGERMKSWLSMGSFVVEKYIFESVYNEFFRKFNEKFAIQDQMFVGRSITCRQKTPTQLLDNLEVKPKFREPGLEASEQIYSDSILELQKMDLCITPKDKLDCLIMFNSRMRAFVIKCHKGKLEIGSMDNELPITIYILSRCSSKCIYSNLEYISLYIKCKELIEGDDLDNELKILTSLSASADYIAKEWDIDSI